MRVTPAVSLLARALALAQVHLVPTARATQLRVDLEAAMAAAAVVMARLRSPPRGSLQRLAPLLLSLSHCSSSVPDALG